MPGILSCFGPMARKEPQSPKKVPSSSEVVDLTDVDLKVRTVPTTPFTDQKPGTSGVRKKTRHFMQEHYLENFVQATLDAVKGSGATMDTMMIASDGRYWAPEAIKKVMQVAFGNGVREIWVGQMGLCSTPAVSAVIRQNFKCFGAFILTASHNPGGIDEDFGIKYNGATGGPDESVYQVMYQNTLNIEQYYLAESLGATLGAGDTSPWETAGREYRFGGDKVVKVIDTAAIHCELLARIFDFPLIKRLVKHPQFSAKFDCMCGAQGPYAKKILVEELGISADSILRGTPLPDFGGHSAPHHGHADPNLTHAHDLVNKMGLDTEGKKLAGQDPLTYPFYGGAWDGDADRNMILGRQFFVIPSDSLAFIVDQADCIPYFKQNGGIQSAARSMPTSRAVDVVCEKKGIRMFETPTGWKFFGNLMESGDNAAFKDKPTYKPLVCGEEAFGTASCHAREKDGMWAVLCYLQILAVKNEKKLDVPDATLTSMEDLAIAHWLEYGRHFYARYDWEEVDSDKAKAFFTSMEERLEGMAGTCMDEELFAHKIEKADNFYYTDPVDGTKASNQGLRIFFEDGSRIVIRLSGTGVVGATIRVYLEKYLKSANVEDLVKNHLDEVKAMGAAMVKWSGIADFTGSAEPSLRT
ncbi:unnamed protein product [Amoebophrya sp. A25]|nr:unnamed protein product [Amoebophrya sp. A25]|eukprot:GSA25T00026079001.1